MYTLKEWWNISIGEDPVKDWDGKVYCTPTNAEMTMQTNLTQTSISIRPVCQSPSFPSRKTIAAIA